MPCAHAGSASEHHPPGCNLNSTFGCTRVHPIPMPGPDPAPRGAAARGTGSHGGGWALRAGLTHLGALARRFGSWEKARVTPGTQGLRLRPTQAAWCSGEPPLAASPRNGVRSKAKPRNPWICSSPLTPPVSRQQGQHQPLKQRPASSGSSSHRGTGLALFLWVCFWEKTCKDAAIGAIRRARRPARPRQPQHLLCCQAPFET